jgi:hypothetical protein
VALYLAQHTGRRYDTLFCDEADGPLDIERKRMFMAMKREVLRLGGYPKASDISSPPCLLRLLPAGAVAGWDLHPLESAAFARRTPIGVACLATLKRAFASTPDAPPRVPPQGAMTSSVGK